jgi:hypothetical protein
LDDVGFSVCIWIIFVKDDSKEKLRDVMEIMGCWE